MLKELHWIVNTSPDVVDVNELKLPYGGSVIVEEINDQIIALHSQRKIMLHWNLAHDHPARKLEVNKVYQFGETADKEFAFPEGLIHMLPLALALSHIDSVQTVGDTQEPMTPAAGNELSAPSEASAGDTTGGHDGGDAGDSE